MVKYYLSKLNKKAIKTSSACFIPLDRPNGTSYIEFFTSMTKKNASILYLQVYKGWNLGVYI